MCTTLTITDKLSFRITGWTSTTNETNTHFFHIHLPINIMVKMSLKYIFRSVSSLSHSLSLMCDIALVLFPHGVFSTTVEVQL